MGQIAYSYLMLSDKPFQTFKSFEFSSEQINRVLPVHQGNILACGVVGAYAVVLAVNAYVYTSLSYITLNILKRFLNTNFSTAFTDVPFQTIGKCPTRRWR